MFNGQYTTQPIRLKGRSRGLKDTANWPVASPLHNLRPCANQGLFVQSQCSEEGAWTTLNQFDGTDGEPFVYGSGTTLEDFDANHIRAALQAMPNFIIPSVNVTDSYPLGTAVTGVDDIRYNNRWFFDVTFTHPANLGEQKLMTCTIASTATDNAAVAPRMSAPTIWEHTGSLEDCFTCTETYQVNLLSNSEACNTAETNEACNGNCAWHTNPTLANKGICYPRNQNCLRDDGFGGVFCDGAAPGVPVLAAGVTADGTVCTDGSLVTAALCNGACTFTGEATNQAGTVCTDASLNTVELCEDATGYDDECTYTAGGTPSTGTCADSATVTPFFWNMRCNELRMHTDTRDTQNREGVPYANR